MFRRLSVAVGGASVLGRMAVRYHSCSSFPHSAEAVTLAVKERHLEFVEQLASLEFLKARCSVLEYQRDRVCLVDSFVSKEDYCSGREIVVGLRSQVEFQTVETHSEEVRLG